jgi:ribosomal protein S18 acetylase RimI-like enzyme
MRFYRLSTQIRPAQPGEARQVATLIAEAFEPLGMTRWLVEDESERIPVMTGFLRLGVEHAIEHGVVEVIGDLDGVAVWLPFLTPEIPDHEQRLEAACGRYTTRFRALGQVMEANHPIGHHEYLPYLAVRPNLRGRGLGRTLLEYHHTKLNLTNQAAYLEAASPASIRLYQRHGYQLIGEPFGPPGTQAAFQPMWRPVDIETRRNPRT